MHERGRGGVTAGGLLQRIAWIDAARFIAIAFVVFGHTYALAPSVLIRFAYAFHLAIFWFLSGVMRRPASSLRQGVAKDFRRLMVPYFFFGSLIFAYRIVVSLIRSSAQVVTARPEPFTYLLDELHALPSLYWRLLLDMETKMTTPLWFLPAMFVVSVVFAVMVRRRGLHLAAVGLALGLSLLAASRSATGKIGVDLVRFYVVTYGFSLCFGFVLFSAGHWSRGWVLGRSGLLKRAVPVFAAAGVAAFVFLPAGLVPAKYLVAFLCVVAWLGVAMLLPAWRPLLYLGEVSLVVLALHEVFFDVTYRLNGVLGSWLRLPPFFTQKSPTFAGQLTSSVALTVLALLLSLPVARLLERACPWGLGRFKPRTEAALAEAAERRPSSLGGRSADATEVGGGPLVALRLNQRASIR
jgi:fucose 4-O-acetylase-like acetyltransferase